MTNTVDLHDSFDDIDQAAWREVCHPEDPFMDRRFQQVLERSRSPDDKFWFALIRDSSGDPLAAVCLSLLPLDLAVLAGGVVRRIAGILRPVFPRALRYKTIFCGLPVSAGQSHLRIKPTAEVEVVLAALTTAMTELAHKESARFLVFKELDDAESARFAGLASLGCYRGESPPMNHFPTRFCSFDEYCAALKAPYRSKIVRSQRKRESQQLRVECLTDGPRIAAQFTDEAYRMYRAVVEKSPVRLEVLSAEWFREMAREFHGESVWLAVYEGDRLLAWAYGLLTGDSYHSLFGGVDYSRNAETDAYFNLMYYELDFALRRGLADIQLGQTADDFKSRLGATQSRRWFFVKPLRWKASLALRLAADSLLPNFPPPTQRHVFRMERIADMTDDKSGIV